MADAPQMFSESWHRIAGQRVQLRPGVDVRRQQYRGELWYVVHDPFTNAFYRIRPGARRFLLHLNGRETVEEAWRRCLREEPAAAPGQSEVIQLLGQLHQASLLQSDLAPDSRQLFERLRRHQQAKVRSTLSSILFLRIPLWDPDRFLKKLLPVVRPVFSWAGFAAWSFVVLAAIKVAIDHREQLFTYGQDVLAPGNLALLFSAFILTKILHEFGHAFACRTFGGEVHQMGFMLLVFSPVPYMDATASWAFRERWRRIWVGAAGMYVELFIAALATFVWAGTGAGLTNSLAYNIMFVASVSTLLFNLNPLLRFDGYYILSDLTDTPNLHQRSRTQMFSWAEKHLFGLPNPAQPAATRREEVFLGLFGIASGLYRIFVFTLIILFVADKFFGLGLLAAIVGGFALLVLPVFRFVRYLAVEPRLDRHRPRAIGVTVGTLAVIMAFLAFFPWPHHTYAPGVLQAREHATIFSGADGQLAAFTAVSGQPVRAGDLIAEMTNPELELRLAAAEARVRQARLQENVALEQGGANLRALRTKREAAEAELADLVQRRRDLEVRAPLAGVWVAPRAADLNGQLIARGHLLGLVIQPQEFEFIAVVPQQDSSRLFAHTDTTAELRFRGQAGQVVPIGQLQLVPGRQNVLPTPALGWSGGGPVKVRPDDPEGLQTAEPYFKAIARVSPSADTVLLHGQTGYIRFTTGKEPLLRQGWRRVRQMLQQRYQI
ncbi:MAG: biotin/lipoyl-binding protein [Opitutaceae bacterium]|nr:biotin/lipoyl-binding protein [Opitutaceae bacterium]